MARGYDLYPGSGASEELLFANAMSPVAQIPEMLHKNILDARRVANAERQVRHMEDEAQRVEKHRQYLRDLEAKQARIAAEGGLAAAGTTRAGATGAGGAGAAGAAGPSGMVGTVRFSGRPEAKIMAELLNPAVARYQRGQLGDISGVRSRQAAFGAREDAEAEAAARAKAGLEPQALGPDTPAAVLGRAKGQELLFETGLKPIPYKGMDKGKDPPWEALNKEQELLRLMVHGDDLWDWQEALAEKLREELLEAGSSPEQRLAEIDAYRKRQEGVAPPKELEPGSADEFLKKVAGLEEAGVGGEDYDRLVRALYETGRVPVSGDVQEASRQLSGILAGKTPAQLKQQALFEPGYEDFPVEVFRQLSEEVAAIGTAEYSKVRAEATRAAVNKELEGMKNLPMFEGLPPEAVRYLAEGVVIPGGGGAEATKNIHLNYRQGMADDAAMKRVRAQQARGWAEHYKKIKDQAKREKFFETREGREAEKKRDVAIEGAADQATERAITEEKSFQAAYRGAANAGHAEAVQTAYSEIQKNTPRDEIVSLLIGQYRIDKNTAEGLLGVVDLKISSTVLGDRAFSLGLDVKTLQTREDPSGVLLTTTAQDIFVDYGKAVVLGGQFAEAAATSPYTSVVREEEKGRTREQRAEIARLKEETRVSVANIRANKGKMDENAKTNLVNGLMKIDLEPQQLQGIQLLGDTPGSEKHLLRLAEAYSRPGGGKNAVVALLLSSLTGATGPGATEDYSDLSNAGKKFAGDRNMRRDGSKWVSGELGGSGTRYSTEQLEAAAVKAGE